MSAQPQSHKSVLYYIGITLLVLFFLGLILPFIVLPLIQRSQRAEAERRAQLEQLFARHMPAYTGKFRPAANPVTPQGKVLIIDPAEKKIAELFYWLGTKRQAQTPGEVSVLVWMDCRVLDMFNYFGQGFPQSADWEVCTVTIIDWSSKTIVAQREFTGQRPPDEILLNSDGYPVAADRKRLDAAAVNPKDVLNWMWSQIK